MENSTGTELWRSDGTAVGTVLVKNIRAGTGSSAPNVVGDLDGIAILTANDNINGREVWRSDGTSAGTFRISDISAGNNSPFIAGFIYQDGLLYFSADDLSVNYGTELYQTDGTMVGTQLVADISPGTGGSSPSQPVIVNGTLYFAAGSLVPHYQLWKLPDEIAPRVVGSKVHIETAHRVQFRFSEDVAASLAPGDVQVQKLVGGAVYSPVSASFDAASRYGTFSLDTILPDGNYRATFAAGAAQDASGHLSGAASSFDFFILAADATHDRLVDARDFNFLAGNFGVAGRTFSQGNFNYDAAGEVNSLDFDLFVAQYGKRLASASATPLAMGQIAAAHAVFLPFRDDLPDKREDVIDALL
jgi:ELWxxDGT repeat protein